MNRKLAAVLCALCALCGRGAVSRAELELQAVSWQTAHWERGKTQKPEDITALSFDPGKRFQGRILARLTVLNRGPAARGVLLRYAMTARIAPRAGGQEAAWSVPFMIDEKRVPNAGANSKVQVTLDPTDLLSLYLRRVDRSGWWPLELKLEVMVEPHRGEATPLKTLTALLPVKP